MATRIIIGVDPGVRAGWCILHLRDGWRYLDSGQTKRDDVAHEISTSLDRFAAVHLKEVHVEKQAAGNRRKIPPHTFWAMGLNAGIILTSIFHDFGMSYDDELVTRHTSDDWRRALGIRARLTRKQAEVACHRWAVGVTGEKLEGPKGGKQVDRAMAIGIAFAGAGR